MDSIHMPKCDIFPCQKNAKRRPPAMVSDSFYWQLSFIVEGNLPLKISASIAREYKLCLCDMAKRLQMITKTTC